MFVFGWAGVGGHNFVFDAKSLQIMITSLLLLGFSVFFLSDQGAESKVVRICTFFARTIIG